MKSIKLALFIVFFFIAKVNAQCELYDGDGIPSLTPQWLSCFGTDYTLVVQSPNNIGDWSLDWGDGSPIENGANLIPPASVSHTYIFTVNSYTVTFTETATGCTVNGLIVMEEPSNASIQIPFGGVTQACAPAILEFTNSSTDVSPTTIFTWDFGDGSPIEIYDQSNAGQTVPHTYLPNTVDCETVVTLTAENLCNTSQGGPSTATFNPIRIWDFDDAAIDASATLLCYPDTTVIFNNITDRNCLAQGNTFQRQEFWNFGDYWGLGYDSIIPWTPWPPTFPYTIDYPGIGSYDVMLIDSNFCGQDTAYITVNIVPPPTAFFSIIDDTVCVGESLTTVNLSSGGANSWFWNFGDGTGWQATGVGNQSHSYVAPGDYTVSLVANIAGGTVSCTDTFTLDIHVLSSPQANIIINNNNGCDTLTVGFTDASIDAVQWDWDFGNGNTSILPNPGSQFYPSPNIYNVSLTVASINGCLDNTTTTINVFQSPVANFIPTSICQNAIAQFTDQSTSSVGDPIIQWDWDFDNGDNSNIQDPTTVYTAVGTYNITLNVNTANCSATGIVPVTVEPTPVAGFTEDVNAGCPNLTVTFNNTSTGAVNYFWDFDDGSTSVDQDPVHDFVNSGSVDVTYNVMMIASTLFGCADTSYQVITVFPGTSASFTHNGIPGCAPLPVDFTNTSGSGATFTWDFGDGNGSTLTNPTHTFINATLFIDVYTTTLIATSPNGCVDSAQQDITVFPLPAFGFTSVPDSGCSPLPVQFPSILGAVQYEWDFGDGNTGVGQSPNHIYYNSSTNDVLFIVELIATSGFGCVDTSYGTVKVFPNPTAQFTIDVTEGCSPFPVSLENTSLGGTNFYWDYGDLQTSSETAAIHSYTYINNGSLSTNHILKLIVETDRGCQDTATILVDVHPEVTAAFTPPLNGCSPLPICFTNNSTNATIYEWDFGDGQLGNTPSPCHTYMNNGAGDVTYPIELIATSDFGCDDTISFPVSIYALPIAQFTPSDASGCNPFPMTIDNQSIGATSFSWNYGDGQFSTTGATTHVHTYFNPGFTQVNTNLELIAENINGCKDTMNIPIEVYPEVLAGFFSDSAECSPVTICMNNTTLNASTYEWDFGDGILGVVPNPCHFYTNTTNHDTTYHVTMIGTSVFGCTDTAYQDVFIYPVPDASFTATPNSQTFPNTNVDIVNNSGGGSWNYEWTFGDGADTTVINPINHDYSTWGTYTINLRVSSPYCSDTTSNTIVIEPPSPIVNFSGQGMGCRPVTIQFIDSSQYVTSYFWEFGDGGVSSQINPLYSYNIPGSYSPSLTVTGPGGQATLFKFDSVVVHDFANAFFQNVPTTVFVPGEPVQFFNFSSMANDYVWEFGDGESSFAHEPIHYYQTEGNYTVTLIARNDFNCPDTMIVENAVIAKLGGEIVFPNAFTPNPDGSNGGSYDPNSFNNDIFFPIFKGVDDYHLMVFNRWGELIFESFDVNIGWDGYYRGVLSQSDVYIWKVRARFTNGNELTKVGELHLIR